MLVLDASLTLAYSFESQATPEIDAIMRTVQQQGALVPATWVVEHWHGLVKARSRGISDDEIGRVWELIRLLSITVEPADPGRVAVAVFPLARAHQLTIYDATYLETAIRNGLPLATCDKSLRRAADSERVTCLYCEPRLPAGG